MTLKEKRIELYRCGIPSNHMERKQKFYSESDVVKAVQKLKEEIKQQKTIARDKGYPQREVSFKVCEDIIVEVFGE